MPDQHSRFALTQVDAGSFTSNSVTLPGGLAFRVRDEGAVLITTVIQGTVRAEWAKHTEGYQTGDVYLRNFPHAEFRAETHDVRSRSIVLPVSLLAATALAVFPNNALTGLGARDRSDASPATLRRAIAFIDEHAHDDITAAEVAAAAGVTIRAVQLAFRRHLDITPLGYLRRVRLQHAHRQLATADPRHESVTAVAYRWGFANSSRFAAYYRQAYGVPPSHTLRN